MITAAARGDSRNLGQSFWDISDISVFIIFEIKCHKLLNNLFCSQSVISVKSKLTLKTFTGHDATETFVLYHRRRFPHKMSKVRDAFVREDSSVSPDAEDKYEDYFELSERVSKVCRI